MLTSNETHRKFAPYFMTMLAKTGASLKKVKPAHQILLSLKPWRSLGLLLLLLTLDESKAAGTWTPLASSPPTGVNNCMLMSDGTVLGMNGDGGCVKLTPDIHGSYIHGTWTTLASMNNSRLFYSS
jgi:hypothetical protein